MLLAAVGPRRFTSDEAIVEMPPMIGCDISWIDAERLHGDDLLQHPLNLRPAGDLQQNLATRMDARKRLIGFASVDCTHDVDARDGRPEVVGCPADEAKEV